MRGITPPPFIDRHGVDPHGIVYVCPATTCRQPHETREAYLAHWDTEHRQLDEPRKPLPVHNLIPDGAKVTYSTLLAQREGGPLAGITSTAYLDGTHDGKGHYFGSNKHTDESVLVRWDEDRDRWLEVDAVALYRAEKETAHRGLEAPRPSEERPGVVTRIAGFSANLSAEQAENLVRYPELLAHLVNQIREGLDMQAAKMDGTPGEFIDVRVIAERLVFIGEDANAQG